MTIGVGGSDPEHELQQLETMTQGLQPIGAQEYRQRQVAATTAMKAQGVRALFINAGVNLNYFTGLKWSPSERMVGALLMDSGDLVYIAPHFEWDTLKEFMQVSAPIAGWHEHESPYELVTGLLNDHGIAAGKVAVDPSVPLFLYDGLKLAGAKLDWINGAALFQSLRARKSDSELALMQCAKSMTLEVHKAAARILRPGITTTEVVAFIDKAHRKVGAPGGSSFCIVLFGLATSFPHGVKEPQVLQEGDWVLIDTGCIVEGYHSDITRSYCFGEPNERQRLAWEAEKAAQLAAFDAAQPGRPCESADYAAREVLCSYGFGPDYRLPGLPHRTGHGCGMEIHEGPYLVRGETQPLAPGMVFSNEPMLVLPGEFGVRLEDHFYLTEAGPRWFTEPAYSIDDPFGYRRG
ncbi:Xaa-Pro peptidase family protein [Ferrimonas sp. YFM]|uniref:M24 family metallopeptidase n=1 Tax=Ferrimonas sp. YFM TaxID=3028878 RepID=UPI002572AAFB|nr:Xaa-Pro peptidase family protein [Ferrimonas sp. YFM]BDY04763.1 metallopeptidase [Ferrimonas sp. YFM]